MSIHRKSFMTAMVLAASVLLAVARPAAAVDAAGSVVPSGIGLNNAFKVFGVVGR